MSPYSDSPQHGSSGARKHRGKPQARHAAKKKPAAKRRRRGRGAGGGGPARSALTSHPTSRNAQMDTRAWLLKEHGPTCAYCGLKYQARQMTLDHVAPRRGQTAYDRRDNLVLACKACNAAKRDLAPLAFLLGLRSRAANLVRYGTHLSAGLLDLARALLPEGDPGRDANARRRERWNEEFSDDDSPYRS